jgi:hypothetical protein
MKINYTLMYVLIYFVCTDDCKEYKFTVLCRIGLHIRNLLFSFLLFITHSLAIYFY